MRAECEALAHRPPTPRLSAAESKPLNPSHLTHVLILAHVMPSSWILLSTLTGCLHALGTAKHAGCTSLNARLPHKMCYCTGLHSPPEGHRSAV